MSMSFRSSEFGRRCNLWDAALKIALPVMWAARFACAMGIRAMLNGSIGNLGSQYVITLEAVNASNGESLAREEVQASRKEEVMNSLHEAGSSLRKKLGESLASVQKFDKALSEATTSSLEALQALSLADAK